MKRPWARIQIPYTPPEDLIALFDGQYQGPVRAAVDRVRRGVGGWDRAHDVFWASVGRWAPGRGPIDRRSPYFFSGLTTGVSSALPHSDQLR